MGTVVGIDVGGAGVKGAGVDLTTGSLVTERVRHPTPSPATPASLARVVADVLADVEASGHGTGPVGLTTTPVGLALPAVVQRGLVRTAAHIDRSWIGVDATAHFERQAGRRFVAINDADAAGLAEMRFGAGRDRRGVVLMLTLGTGVGSALFVDGALVPNTELGHLAFRHGDAENWVAESVRQREALSWKAWAHRLQDYLDLLERLLWPELVIIGGGASRKADKFLPYLRPSSVEVVPAALRNNAGIVGAAQCAVDLGCPGNS